MKIDFDTPLERTLSSLTLLFAGILAGFLKAGWIGNRRFPPDPALLSYVPLIVGCCIFFAVLRWYTDNYYLADVEKKRLLYHFRFLFYRTVSEKLAFSQIDSVVVSAVPKLSMYSNTHMYQLQVIDQQGRRHELGDPWKGQMLDLLNGQAKMLASSFGCRFFPGTAGHTYVIVRKGKAELDITASPLPLGTGVNREVPKEMIVFAVIIGVAVFGSMMLELSGFSIALVLMTAMMMISCWVSLT